MKRRDFLRIVGGGMGLFSLSSVMPAVGGTRPVVGKTKPNILILYIDDMGYADLGVTGNTQCPTPNIDSIAKNGARFENSYVTACVCSPSRAAVMSGRYQQRFGFDANAEGGSKPVKGNVKGLELSQPTFADRFKAIDYVTGIVGKWHIGSDEPAYLPNSRGFDEFYGLLPHGIGAGKNGETVPIWRNRESAPVPEDHTVTFGKEAESFIDRHKDAPWFLYCAFTAVHAPFVSPKKYETDMAQIEPVSRGKYLAMLSCLDDVIGRIMEKLREHGLEENTLIFLASDNGGPGGAANNGIFRGTKWTLWEGGIRSPICIQWKGRIQAGQVIPHMVTQLDWLPTALAAAGVEAHPEWKLDGVNILPLLEGKTDAAPHNALFWRFGVQYAVREGDWKLVKAHVNDAPRLHNLVKDPGEQTDLAAQEPDRVKQLQGLWDEWNKSNEPPRWVDERWNGEGAKPKKKAARQAKGKK
ncbi:MAG: hypothetical protein A2283_15180 [Lentisphaerae bacterium RIFOXYA12_FULL_48_11]|nr:MAG: hypothetical protein A2283_15180 [Lentisphaerae bacterium RIFOXYA12_FULL_48_11]